MNPLSPAVASPLLPIPTTPTYLIPLIYETLQNPQVQNDINDYLKTLTKRIVSVPERAVTTSFLKHFISPDLCVQSPGQLVHGSNTNGPPDDWKHFDINKDPTCIRGLTTNSTGLSIIETMLLLAKVTNDNIFSHDPLTGEPYFGKVDIFVSYGWHGTAIGDLQKSIIFFEKSRQQRPKKNKKNKSMYFWIDVFAIAQNRDSEFKKAANSSDVGAFADVVKESIGTALYWSPLTKPAVLGRVWCLYEILQTIKINNSIELLMKPSDRQTLLNNIKKDNGKSLIFQIEGQSSVNAASTYERDWCRIHTSIEVELNPKSMGTFVRAPDTINQNDGTGKKISVPFSNFGNASEGWLGNGDWVTIGKIHGNVNGQTVPPWIDYVFIDDEGYGEMNGTIEGHLILDQMVKESIYNMFNNILNGYNNVRKLLCIYRLVPYSKFYQLSSLRQ